MSDSLTVFGTDFTGVTGIKATQTGDGQLTYIRPTGTKQISSNGTGIDVTNYASVDVSVSGGDSTFVITVSWNSTSEMWEPDCTYAQVQAAYQAGKTIVVDAYGDSIDATADGEWNTDYSRLTYWVHQYDVSTNLLTEWGYYLISTGIQLYTTVTYIIPNFANLTKTYTPTETQQTENITIPSGNNGINSVGVTVNAISSSYVGSGITRCSSSDLTVSGATVTAPAGYYASTASKAVASGTAGTPTATKGTVSNHQVSVTPSVTNQSGYITGSTKTGTAVTVSASELVSGNLALTDNTASTNCTNYATVSVTIPFVTYYTSSSSPTSSQGSNGDIWLKTVS